jgi:hypothetical protein
MVDWQDQPTYDITIEILTVAGCRVACARGVDQGHFMDSGEDSQLRSMHGGLVRDTFHPLSPVHPSPAVP